MQEGLRIFLNSYLYTMSRFSSYIVTRSLTLLMVFGEIIVMAQQPVITEVNKSTAGFNEVVTVKGSNFGASAAQVQVWFGAAQGSIVSITDQLMEVTVPAGATYDQIYVTKTSNGLSTHSSPYLLYSFGGTPGILAANFSAQVDFQGQSGLYDICLCDFNSDGKVDIASANDNDNSIAFFQNGSVVGTFTFPKLAVPIAARSLHLTCGDLNGDGRSELIISEGGEGANLFILKNNGAYSFTLSTVNLTGKKPKRAEVADLDGDGKPDLIVTDQKSGTLTILKNQSTLATLSFAAPQFVTIPGATTTDGLDVADLNGDGRPEVVLSQFLTTNSNVFILKNTSNPGSISLDVPLQLTIGSTVVSIKLGDLDGDKKTDIAVTQLLGSRISAFLNQSTTTTLQFAAPVVLPTDERPWGLDIGDLDGDGKAELITTSITKKSITILNNLSTPGNLSFTQTLLPTTFINRHIKIGDLDTDGKPDIAFTSIDDNNSSPAVPASKVSIIRNRTCLKPSISPEGPLTICSGFPLQLKSSQSGGATYEWRRDGVVVSSGVNAFFDVTLAGSYTVTAIAETGSCSQISNPVNVTIGTGSATGTAVANNNGPVCFGDNLQLSVNDVGATEYRWSGPANYTGTGLNPPAILNFSSEKSGRYELEVYVGTCLAQKTFTVVETISIPTFSLSTSGGNLFCNGSTKSISLTPTTAGFTYKWFENTLGEIAGETASSFVASATGNYYAEITSLLNPGCQPQQTTPVELVELDLIVANFTAPAEACVGQSISFSNQTTSDSRSTPLYTWTFEGTNTSTAVNPQYTYTTMGTKTVKLAVSYTGGLCPTEVSKAVIINAVPTISISQEENIFSICPEGSLVLSVSGGPYTAYSWSTGVTTPTASISEPGTVSVEVTTSNGCVASDTQLISKLAEPIVTVIAEPAEISLGTSSQLTASGLITYAWTPAESLSDATIANPIASPLQTTTYTVTGNDVNGCTGEGSIEIAIKGEDIVSLLNPANSFSPNGDAQNEFWTIDNILTFTQCAVSIYDEKGMKVFEAKPYLNSWDGTSKGTQLPQGVYYYIIRCDGQESTPRTGSITLVR